MMSICGVIEAHARTAANAGGDSQMVFHLLRGQKADGWSEEQRFGLWFCPLDRWGGAQRRVTGGQRATEQVGGGR